MSAPVEPVTSATGDTSDTALYQLKRFSEAADKIRANAANAAKTLGGLGTAGIAAVGVAKFSDVFPLPDNDNGWAVPLAVAVVVGFVLMLLAVLLLTGRLWRVSEPVFTTSDVQAMVELKMVTGDERPLVAAVYQETAKLNEVDSLPTYEAKAIQLESQAATAPAADRPALRAQASAIRNDIRATQARAAALIVRRRAAAIGNTARLSVLVFLFAFGLALANLSADKLDALRAAAQDATTDKKVATVKACADAAEALAKNNISMASLPPGCSKPVSPAQIAETLATVANYTQCITANTGTQDCAALLAALNKAAG